MVNSFGSNPYADAEMAYQRQRMQRDFAAINVAAQQRASRRARAAELRAAGQQAPVPGQPRRASWLARLHRNARPVAR